jgi:hypothetical protein
MPTVITQGAASAKGYGFGASSAPPVYIEDVFSTWLYTGTGSGTVTNNNGIDLTGKGGMVWIKSRTSAGSPQISSPIPPNNHYIFDTVRTNQNALNSASIYGQDTSWGNTYFRFLSNGFDTGTNGANYSNDSGNNYATWSFRKQAKFFDIVTYTGTGANRTIAHNLGAVPGCIMIKRTDTTAAWAVYHRSLANTQYMVLNTTAAAATGATYWNSTTPTSSVFSLGTSTDVNASSGTYVAYLFAHDAGGFGATGSDNVISCGSFTTDGSANATVSLGYEPQFVMVKSTSTAGAWVTFDSMRGMPAPGSNNFVLFPNTSDAEISTGGYKINPSATGMSPYLEVSTTYIYIAIRRGPMKTPTTGTSVFGLNARTGTGANATVTGGQTDDAVLIKNRGRVEGNLFAARLTLTGYLETSSTAAEVAAGTTILQANPWDVMDGVKVGTIAYKTNATADTFINYLFRRAPGFFDVVCYTGTGSVGTESHNLGVAPELMIVKQRAGTAFGDWFVYSSSVGATKYLSMQTTAAAATSTSAWNNTSPTSTVFTRGTFLSVASATFVAYLFATVAGVSKVGFYTGTGTTNQINCGFTGGARFVMIKRTDSTGDWYVWDSARGIVAGNDPYLLLNSTAAEVTGTDYVDTYSLGFEISSTAPAAINANGGTFIFLAIA